MVSLILGAISSFILQTIETTGYLGVFFLMALESAGVPIPSEIVMPFSGYLASTGPFSIWLAAFWATVGNLFGSLALYLIGCYGGRRLIIRYGRYFLINEGEMNRADEWFKKYGSLAIFFSRMTPIVRTYISLPAGLAKMNLPKFLVYTFLGSVPWNFALTYIGFILGKNWQVLEVYFRKFDYLILILILAGIGWWLWRRFKNRKLQLE
jgi:membrane protein DedA with SNARE-associated domain